VSVPESGTRRGCKIILLQENTVMAVVAGDDKSESQNADFFLAGSAATEPSGVIKRTNQTNSGLANGGEVIQKILQFAF
jgi:hypothetical protein